MNDRNDLRPSRRRFLRTGLAGAGLTLLGCGGGRSQKAFDASPQPKAALDGVGSPPIDAPACIATEDNIEGPFYKSGAPSRISFVDRDARGVAFAVSGRVVDELCKPIPRTRMEFWHANHKGEYDNSGFRFRGTLETDSAGLYRLDTIVPGHYKNGDQYRPAHIHVKLAAPGRRPLTTQLYFEGDPYNEIDPWIRESLIMRLEAGDRYMKEARFEFVLPRV